MATYTHPPGICAVDDEPIPKTDAHGKGYKSPLPAHDEVYDAGGVAQHRYTFEALCKEHYLAAYAEVHPNVDPPNI